jgi:hypothetical protein
LLCSVKLSYIVMPEICTQKIVQQELYHNWLACMHALQKFSVYLIIWLNLKWAAPWQNQHCVSVSLVVIGLVSEQHGSWSDCADAQAGLDPFWSQTHYFDFVMVRLKWSRPLKSWNSHEKGHYYVLIHVCDNVMYSLI